MKRSSIVVLALAVVAVAAGAWYMFWPRVSLPVDPLAAVPADAYGVVHIRVDRVLASDAWKRLIVERGQAQGLEHVQAKCGFNPLAKIRELTVFARPAPGGGMPKLAFTARGDLNHEELIDCVQKVAGDEASSLQRADIEGVPTVQSKKGSSRAAFMGRDGIVGGDADSVAAVIQAVLQKAPPISSDAMIKGLYGELEQGSDITLVSRLPDEARPLIRELATVAGPQVQLIEKVKLFGLSWVTSSTRLAGGLTMVTGSPEEASAFVEIGKNAIANLLQIPGIGMTPAYGVLKTVQTEVRGDRATFSGQIKVASIETLLELAPAIEQLAGDMAVVPIRPPAQNKGDAAVPEPAPPTNVPPKPSSVPPGVPSAAPPSAAPPAVPTPTVEQLSPTPAPDAETKRRRRP